MNRISISNPKSPSSTQVLQRSLRVLDAILQAGKPLGLESICSITGLRPETVENILASLVQGQYLVETEDGFWPGLKMVRFGALAEDRLVVKQQAFPYLTQLRDQVNETIHLAVLDRDFQVVYLEKLSSLYAIGLMQSRVGYTAPMHCTAVGKTLAAYEPREQVQEWLLHHPLKAYTYHSITDPAALFAELDEIRAAGFAVDNEEHEQGVRCVAAPIFDLKGHAVAAVSISGPDHRLPAPLAGSTVASRVMQTARFISNSLGYTGPFPPGLPG
jgi:DNA-binding IclR family transcriptional regulator